MSSDDLSCMDWMHDWVHSEAVLCPLVGRVTQESGEKPYNSLFFASPTRSFSSLSLFEVVSTIYPILYTNPAQLIKTFIHQWRPRIPKTRSSSSRTASRQPQTRTRKPLENAPFAPPQYQPIIMRAQQTSHTKKMPSSSTCACSATTGTATGTRANWRGSVKATMSPPGSGPSMKPRRGPSAFWESLRAGWKGMGNLTMSRLIFWGKLQTMSLVTLASTPRVDRYEHGWWLLTCCNIAKHCRFFILWVRRVSLMNSGRAQYSRWWWSQSIAQLRWWW